MTRAAWESRPVFVFLKLIIMQNFKVITTISGFQVETYDKADAAILADYIDHSQNWNVTEVVFSWATEQCIIRCYPTDQTSGQTELNKLITQYYE